jgi:hypothetical protein
MKRIILMLTVAAMMAAAMVVNVPTGFAAPPCPDSNQRSVKTGPGTFECVTPVEGRNPKFSGTQTQELHGSNPQGSPTFECNDSNPGSSCPPGQFNRQ